MSFWDRVKNAVGANTDWNQFFSVQHENPAWMKAIPNSAWEGVGLKGVAAGNRESAKASMLDQALSALDTAGIGYDASKSVHAPTTGVGAEFEGHLPTAIAPHFHTVREDLNFSKNEAGALDPVSGTSEAGQKALEALAHARLASYHPPQLDYSVTPGDPNAAAHVSLQGMQRLAAGNPGYGDIGALDRNAYAAAGRPNTTQLARGELPSNQVIGGVNDIASLQALARQRAAANPGAILQVYGGHGARYM